MQEAREGGKGVKSLLKDRGRGKIPMTEKHDVVSKAKMGQLSFMASPMMFKLRGYYILMKNRGKHIYSKHKKIGGKRIPLP